MHGNALCDCHASLKDVSEILPNSAHFWTAVTEMREEDHNVLLLNKCEFHESECSVSSNLLTGVSDILPMFLLCPFWIKFNTGDFHNNLVSD